MIYYWTNVIWNTLSILFIFQLVIPSMTVDGSYFFWCYRFPEKQDHVFPLFNQVCIGIPVVLNTALLRTFRCHNILLLWTSFFSLRYVIWFLFSCFGFTTSEIYSSTTEFFSYFMPSEMKKKCLSLIYISFRIYCYIFLENS